MLFRSTDLFTPVSVTVQDNAGNTYTFDSTNSGISYTEGGSDLYIDVTTPPELVTPGLELQTEGLVVTAIEGLGCQPATP